jgi:hypothetical protein
MLTSPVLDARYSRIGRSGMVEFWGLGVLVAVCRYFFNTDWELKVKRRRRGRKQHRA